MTKAENMFALVEEWKQSGKNQKDFCQASDLNVGTFGFWVFKKRRADRSLFGGFTRIDVTGEKPDTWRSPILKV